MTSYGAAAVHAFPSARAVASRVNGAKSKGPRTAAGKARASQNALKHGMCAKKFLLLPDDSRGQFAALESALLEELRPEGVVQTLLAHRLIAAAWRLARADRLEFELLIGDDPRKRPGRMLTRDGGAERAFATVVRYRNGAQTEFFRTLKALQAGQAEPAAEADEAPAARIDRAPPALRPAVARRAVPEECPPRQRFQEVAAPEAPGEAEPRSCVQARDANAPRNEPERSGSGHQCVTKATRNEPRAPRADLAAAFPSIGPGTHKETRPHRRRR